MWRSRNAGRITAVSTALAVFGMLVSAGPASALTGPAGIIRASVSTAGAPADSPTPALSPPAVSTDGRYIAFDSGASNLWRVPRKVVSSSGTRTPVRPPPRRCA